MLTLPLIVVLGKVYAYRVIHSMGVLPYQTPQAASSKSAEFQIWAKSVFSPVFMRAPVGVFSGIGR